MLLFLESSKAFFDLMYFIMKDDTFLAAVCAVEAQERCDTKVMKLKGRKKVDDGALFAKTSSLAFC